MNLLSLLDKLSAASGPASTPPAVVAAGPAPYVGRRALLRTAGQVGVRALATALPLAAALPAVAGVSETTFDSLTLLLTLADLQAALYTRALATPGLVPAAARPDLARIQELHGLQTGFLRGTDTLPGLFKAAGAVAPAVPTFDFSGSHQGAGPAQFADPFGSFDDFLQLAQPLADAAARIYLGQLATLRSNTPLLEATVRRQAVEARLAAHLRTLRRGAGALPKSWPSPTDPAAPAALASTQAGESSLRQLVPGVTGLRYVDFNALFPNTPVQTTALAEAFDEPLPLEQAAALLALFQ